MVKSGGSEGQVTSTVLSYVDSGRVRPGQVREVCGTVDWTVATNTLPARPLAALQHDRRGLLFRADAEGVRVDALVEAELSQVYYPLSQKGSALSVNR